MITLEASELHLNMDTSDVDFPSREFVVDVNLKQWMGCHGLWRPGVALHDGDGSLELRSHGYKVVSVKLTAEWALIDRLC